MLQWPMTGTLDLRSSPDQLPQGSFRMRQNFQTVANGVLRRGSGFTKFLTQTAYNNADFHDQLLSLSSQTRSPLTLLFEAESTREVRSLIAANQSTIAQLDEHNATYKILGSGFGGVASTDANAPRFKAARLGDYVLFTNNFDKVRYMVLEQPPTAGQYLYTLPDLDTIGLSKAAVIAEWRNCIFLANVVMDGNRVAYRLLWSDFNGPISFDPAVLSSITGSFDMYTHESIMAGAPAGNSFLWYTTHGIWEMVAVGGDKSFDFRRVYNAEEKYGSDLIKACLKYPNSLCNLHDAHCYIGHDGIYFFNQYYSAPDRPEWLHLASADLLSNLDTSVCEPHIAAPFGDEVLFSVATTAATNHCPDYTLRANKTYKVCDIVDHGFLAFCQYRPQDVATVRDFIVENQICTLAGLEAAGYPYGKQCLPTPLPAGSAPFTPNCIYTTVRKAITLADGSTIHVEDYTQPTSSPTSLCALLGGLNLNTICDTCGASPLFLAASSVDWCIKQLGGVFYREICLNPTAVGATTSDGYTAATGSYVLNGITSILRSPPAFSPGRNIVNDGLLVNFEPGTPAQNPPLMISLRVGISGQPADPNVVYVGAGGVNPIRWFQRSAKPLAYSAKQSQAQYDQSNQIPSMPLRWNYKHEGKYIYLELTITGVGGDAKFSSLAADIAAAGPTRNY